MFIYVYFTNAKLVPRNNFPISLFKFLSQLQVTNLLTNYQNTPFGPSVVFNTVATKTRIYSGLLKLIDSSIEEDKCFDIRVLNQITGA